MYQHVTSPTMRRMACAEPHEPRCLVVGGRATQQQRWVDGLTAAGWQVRTVSAESLIGVWSRWAPDLLIVDLVMGEHDEVRLREACESLVEAFRPSLWMVHGHTDEPSEEIWARQLGAWMYVPGLETLEDCVWMGREALAARSGALSR